MSGEMTVARTRSGWAVSAGEPYYLKETRTRREAQAWIEQAKATQAMLAEARAGAAARAAGQVSGYEATMRAARGRVVEFVRLGFAGASLYFRADVRDVDTFRRCVNAMDGYNRFSGDAVADAIGGIFGELAGAEVGRESSPVLYLRLPFTAQQRIGSREGCVPIPDREREALAERIRVIGRDLHAGEITTDERDGRPYRIRLWWD